MLRIQDLGKNIPGSWVQICSIPDPLSEFVPSRIHYPLCTRFDKANVRRLAGLLDRLLDSLEYINNCGRLLTRTQQICVCLGFLGSGHLTRIAGLCGGISQKAAWCAVRRVVNAICALKDEFIRMATNQECAVTARFLQNKFDLPRFAFGVDGVVVKFEAPRGIPEDTIQQDFWNLKMTYALNVQIVGNHEGCILDLCADWQGATADAGIWNASPVKFIIDCQCHYLVAGDFGYPISETCITPYRVAEAAGDPSKSLFNRKHSGLRTLCTECIFGPWKHRWRCLKLMRTKYAWAQETGIACGILHNIGIEWADAFPDNEVGSSG